MGLSRRAATAAAAVVVVALAGLPPANSAETVDPADPDDCAGALAAGTLVGVEDRRDCVITVASTYLGGEEGTVAPADVLLDPEVARYPLGGDPAHDPDGAASMRAAWAAGEGVGAISDPEWSVDGDDAFVAYDVHDTVSGPVTRHVAARITLRDGLVWEILENPTTGTTGEGARTTRTPFHEAAAVAGPMHDPVDMTVPDYDNGAYCSLVIAEEGDGSLTPEQERSCLIAIAATYVDAEGNEIADSLTLFDPRFSKYSLGGPTNHHPGNSDTNRMDQIALSPTIRRIENKQWTADTTTDQVWVVYDGYLPVSVDKPGFYVAERFTIRDGLIWEIMISPVVIDVPDGLVPSAPPAPEVRATVMAGPLATTAGFVTRTVPVVAGQGADFLNGDTVTHDVVSDEEDANGDPVFRSSYTRGLEQMPVVGVEDLAPGTHPFYCSIHPGMRGSLVVVARP